MVRRAISVHGAIGAAVAAALTMAAGAGIATAEPGAEAAACDWKLTGPSLVDVSGTTMVTAMVTPGECTGQALAMDSTACVATASDVGRCQHEPGYSYAQVFYSPYVPGTNYVVKGRGCAAPKAPSAPVCTSLGPVSAVL
ncbi:hypothetical protein [Mycolicibacterium palauense]|uniref:hypothetical protein n=1 Tax=Mycolicibacterium palauense TaxID=2034511 RepID=UPI0011455A3F|nr:hypothetical protein [Mycolicibacterium palauense]